MSRHVFKRAAEDEAKGDLGSARDRLAASAAGTGFPPETCEAVARLSVRMHDPMEAGRWFLLTACDDDEARKAIDFFLDSHNRQPKLVIDRLPKGLIAHLRQAPMPKHLHDSLVGLGVLDPNTLITAKPEKAAHNTRDDQISIGCLVGSMAFLIVILVSSCFGLAPMWRFFSDLL